MNYYAVSALINCIVSLFIGIIVFVKNPRKQVNWSFTLFAFSVGLWSLFYFFWQTSDNEFSALFWSRIFMVFAIFIAPFYLHFVFALLDILGKRKPVLIFIYLLSVFFLLTDLLTNQFVKGVVPLLGFKYWPLPGVFFHAFLFVWISCVIYSTYLLYQTQKTSPGLLKMQIKYVFLGMAIAFAGGSTNYLLWYQIPILPVGNFLVPFYVGMIAYAIIRHRFLDIRLVIARTIAYTLLLAILGLIYSMGLFVLGTFLFPQTATNGSQLAVSTLLALFLAFTFQPLRLFLEKITDRIFFKARYDAQKLLRGIGKIMASTITLSDLAEKILSKLTNQMKIQSGFLILMKGCSIIWVKGTENAKHPEFNEKSLCSLIEAVAHKQHDNLLVFEEMYESEEKNIMREHDLDLVLPLVVKDEVIGALLLSEKNSGDMYSIEDIDVLKILAPEVALAVKNSLSYEEIKRFNITLEEEIKQATKKLEDANEKLKELDRLKDEFVSIASHELRTPMTAIKGYLWMAINKIPQSLDPQFKNYLDIAYNSTDRLIKLVKDMLTISRMEGNRYELKMEQINLPDLTKQIYEELKISADERKINFTLEPFTGHGIINADLEKMREVLQNIIGNALKYTPNNGSITISFKKIGDVIQTLVKDTGPGIAKEDIPKLFQKFNRINVDYAKANNIVSTGLGLYITNQIISLHHGEIEVESTVGEGSTFIISVPEYKS